MDIPFCFLPLLLAALLLGGCYKTQTVRPAEQRSAPNAIDIQKINASGNINKAALVESVYESRDTGLLRVQVNLANRNRGTLGGNKTRGIKYQFAWYDQNGMRVASNNEGWKTLLLQTQQFGDITGTAPTPDVVDWRLSMETWDGN